MNLETQKNSDAETSPFLQFKQLQNSQGFNATTKDKREEKNQSYQQKSYNQSRSIEKRVRYQNQPSSSVNSSKDVNRSARASFKEHIQEKQLKQQMQQQQQQSILSRQLKRSKYRENHSLTLYTQYKQLENQQQPSFSPPKILPSSSSIQYQQFSKQIVPNMLNFQHRSQSTENQLTQNSNLLNQQSAVGQDKTQLLFESYFVDSAYGKTQKDFAVLRQLKTGNDIETARINEKRKESLADKIDLLLPKRPQTQQDIKQAASWRGEGGEEARFSPSKTQPSWTLNLGPALKNVIFKPEDNFVFQGTSASMKALPMEITHNERNTTKIASNPMTSLSRIQAEFDRRSTSEHVCSNNNNNTFYTTNKDHYQPTAIKLIQHALQPRQQQLLEEQQQYQSQKQLESSSSSSSPYHMKLKNTYKSEKEENFLKDVNSKVDDDDEAEHSKAKTIKLLNLQEILLHEDQQDYQANGDAQKQSDMECSLKDELKASPINTRLSQQAFFPQTKNPSQNSLRNVNNHNNNMFPTIVPLNPASSCNFQQTPNGEYFSNPLIMLKTQSKNTSYTNTTRVISNLGITQTQSKNSINTTAVAINNNNNISISPSPRSIKQQSFHLTSRKEKIRPAIQTYLNSRARHPVMSQRGSISSQEEPPLFLKISSIKTSSTTTKQPETLPKKKRFSPEKYLIDKQGKPLENSSIKGANTIASVIRIKEKQSKEGTPAGRNQNQIITPQGTLEEVQLDFVPRSQSFTELSRKTLSSFHQYQANKTNKTDANSEEVYAINKCTAISSSIIHEEQKKIKIDVISPGGNKKITERNQNQKQLRNEGINDAVEGNNPNKLKSPTQKGSNSYRNQQSIGEQSKIMEVENENAKQNNAMNMQEMNPSSFFFMTKKKINNNNNESNSLSNQASPRAVVITSNNSKQTQQKPKVFLKQFTQVISGRDSTPHQQPSPQQQRTSGSQLIRVQTVPSIGRDANQNYFEDLPKKPIKIIQMSAMEQSSLSPLQKQQKQLQQHKANNQQLLLSQNQQQLIDTQTTEDSPIKNSIIPMYIRNYSSMSSRNDNSIIYANIKATYVSLECILKIEDSIDEIKIHLLKGFSQNKNLVELVREFCLIPQEEFIAEMMRFFKFVLETAKKAAKEKLAEEERTKQTFSLAKEKKDVLQEESTMSKSSSGSPRQKLLSLKKAAQLIKTANGAISKMGFNLQHEKDSGHGSMKFQIIPKIILDWLVNELHIQFRELGITATEGFFAQYVQLAINNLLPHSLYQELGSERGIRNFIGLVIEKLHEELDFELSSLTGSFEVIFNTVQAIVQNDFTFLQSLLVATTTLKLTSVEFYLLKNVIIEVFFAQHRAATSSKEQNSNSNNNNHTTPITQQLTPNTASHKQPESATGGIQDFTKYYNELVLASSNHDNNNKNMNSSQLFQQQQKLKGNTSNQPTSTTMTTSIKLDQQSSEKLSKQQRAAAATRISRQLFAAEDGCVNRYTRNEILERVEVTRAIILRRSRPIEDPRIISEICFMIAQDRAFLKHRRGQLSSLRSIEAFLTELSSVLFLTREKREGFIAQQQKLIGYVLDIPFWESLKDAYLSVMKKPQNKYLSSRAFLIDLELRFYYILVDANLLERPVFSLLENTAQLVEELFLWVEDQHFQLGSKFTHDLILSYDRRCMTFFLQDAMLYGVYSALDTEYALLYFKIQPDIVQLWMSGIKNILKKPIFQLTPTQQTELTVFLQNLIPID